MQSRVFIVLATMDYELSHHVHTWRRVKPKVFFYIVTFRLFLQKKVGKILLGEFFDNFKTIISLALVKWVMITANSALWASLAIYHFISKRNLWNNC